MNPFYLSGEHSIAQVQSTIQKGVENDPELKALIEKHTNEAVIKQLPLIAEAEVARLLTEQIRYNIRNSGDFNKVIEAAVASSLARPETLKAMEDAAMKVFTEDGSVYRAVSYKFQSDLARLAEEAIGRAAKRYNSKQKDPKLRVTKKPAPKKAKGKRP